MKNTKIEWATHTFNPWQGCTKVSPACDNCYAANYGNRFGVEWGAGKPRKRTSESTWKQPLRWNKQAKINQSAWDEFKAIYPDLTDEQIQERGFIKPERPRVFCASLADVFDNEVPSEWRLDLFELISQTPYLDWLLLTKRVGNVEKMLGKILGDNFFGADMSHVWLGITICNQEEADRDIPKLLQIPAAKRFLSVEPMLENITIKSMRCNRDHNNDGDCDHHPSGCPRIDLVICGGETGKNARPMRPDWVRSLRDQCADAGVPFFFKQWGEFAPNWLIDPDTELKINGSEWIDRIGKKHSGRLLDGILHNEFPWEN